MEITVMLRMGHISFNWVIGVEGQNYLICIYCEFRLFLSSLKSTHFRFSVNLDGTQVPMDVLGTCCPLSEHQKDACASSLPLTAYSCCIIEQLGEKGCSDFLLQLVLKHISTLDNVAPSAIFHLHQRQNFVSYIV